MNKKYFFRTALSLLLAFAMTFAPVMSSYAVIATALTGEPAAAAEDNATAGENDSADSQDQSGSVAPDSNVETAEDTVADQDSKATETPGKEPSDVKPEETAGSTNAETPAEKPAAASDEKKETEAKAENAEDAEEAKDTKDTKDTYVFEDSKVKVTAVLKDPSAVPDDAKLVVVPVDKDSQDYNYDAYMDALNEDSDSEYSDNNTLLYDIAFIKDGVEIQPAKGNVSVSFEFLDSQLSESLGANKAADVNVIHLPLTDTAKEKYDTTADAKDINAGDIKVEEVNAAVNVDSEKVSFNTDDFSVYAYTVDFAYGEYKFSIPGEGSIKLSEVFEQLHIDKDVKDVENVTFSDPELVEVKKNLIGSNWTLTSKKAFSTEETLTVEMKDGETIEIKVTDAQDAYSVTVNFVSQNQTSPVTPGQGDAPAITGNYYARAYLRDADNKIVGWGITPISLNQSTQTVSISSFHSCTTTETTDPDTGVTTIDFADSGSTISYQDAIDAGYTVGNVRIVSGNNPNNGNEANAMDPSDPDGYTFVSNKQNDDKTASVVTLRVANESRYFVRIASDEQFTIPDNTYLYAWITVEHTTGTNTEALVQVKSEYASSDGKTYDIPVTEWYVPYQGQALNEKITGHEKKVTVKLWAGNESGITYDPANSYNGKLKPIVEKGAINDYIVDHYPVVPKDYEGDYERVTVPDDDNRVTYRYDVVRLSKDNSEIPEYSLEYILNGYNVVTLCDPSDTTVRTHEGINYVNGGLTNNIHMMGGALIRGELSGSQKQIADSSLLTKPSYIGSFDNLTTEVSVNGRKHNTNPPALYIGSENTVTGDIVNGVDFTDQNGLNRFGKTVANSDYIDWDALRSAVVDTSNALIDHSTTVTVTRDLPTDNGAYVVTVHGGENVTISNPDNLTYKIEIVDVGDASSENTKATIVNVLDEGDTALPMLYQIDGVSPGEWLQTHADPDGAGSGKEDGTGLSLVWNFPKATYITTSSQSPELGHVVAPNADVKIASGDYNGCIVCNSAYSNSEGHQWAYKGGSLISASVSFVIKKTVNGLDPASDQKYTFTLQAWNTENNSWVASSSDNKLYQEVQNEGNNVNFKEIKWNRDGTYFYLLSEKNTGEDEFTVLDGTKFIVKVVVTHTNNEQGDEVYSHGDTYYRLDKSVDASTVIRDGEVTTGEKVTQLGGPDDAEFANTVTGGLAISKEVSNEENCTQKFKFEVALKDKDGNALTGDVNAVISETDKDDVSKTFSLTDGKFEVELTPLQTVTIIGLIPGTSFTVSEKETAGYSQTTPENNGNFEGTIEAGRNKVFSANFINAKEAKGEITLTKTGKDNAKLAGAKFDLYRVKTGDETADVKINTEDLVTDSKGEITVDNLEPGTYYFVETEAPEGYVTPTGDAAKTETREVEAGQASLEPLTVSMTNTEEAKGKITLTKEGKDNAKLAGAKFDLYRVKTGDETADVKINTEDLVTDSKGEITVDNLEPGTYYFVETEAPEGYVTPTGDAAKTETREVEAGQASLEPLTVSMTNTEEAKGEITLTKEGKDNAKLAGAKFDLYRVKTGDETADVKINTKDLVTDSKGEITVDNLEPGTYYFVETEAPEGYVTPTGDAAKTETREVEAGQASLEPLTVSMTNTEEAKGKITLTKEGKDNAKLAGAKFDLYRVKTGDETADVKINTKDLVTDSKGEITVDNLEPGTYYFVETEAPEGYVTPTGDAAKTETREVEAGKESLEPLTVSMTNTEEGLGQIILTKSDENNSKKLGGAKFSLYKVAADGGSDTLVEEDIISNAEGIATADNLKPGTYYFVETEAPEGYVTPTGDAAKTETRIVKAGQAETQTLTVSMTNKEEAKGEITLTKEGKDNAKLAGAKFDLYRVKTGDETADVKINTKDLVTDSNGEIKVTDLEPGTYYFVETEAPEGYVTPTGDAAKTETREVEAGKESLEPLTVSMTNTEEAKGEITLTKEGKDNAKLAGAKFDLYRVKTGDETADVKINTKDLVTDSKGEITVDNLEPGTYYFVETEAPEGYVTPTGDAAKTETKVVAAGQTSLEPLTVSMTNTEEAKGKITLTKTGKDNAKLAGAKFDLYKEGEGLLARDTKINTEDLVTDSKGEITVDNLEPGTYYFVETEAPKGYVTPTGDAAKTETRVVEAGQASLEPLTVSMTNTEEAKGKITLTKEGKDNAKLAGAKFDLYRVKTGDETADVKINTEDLVTDSKGEITVDNLEPGTYYFVETEAPEGYVTPTGDAAKTETREVEAGQASLEPLTVSMTNTEEAKGKITLTKEGKDNAKLAGAKFDLYRVKTGDETADVKINTKDLVTDSKGEITVDNLEPGTYYFVETEAPEGYVTPTGDAAKTETKVVAAGQASLEPLTVSMTNTEEAKGKITLTKEGKDNAKLAGAKFDLYRVKTGDETADVKINTKDLVTDSKGEITVDNLEPGTYYFVETEAPEGYVTPTGDAAKTETREVEAGKESLESLTVSMTNTEEGLGQIILTKSDENNSKKLGGAKFSLYKVAADGGSDTLVEEDIISNAEGIATADNLKPGTYYFVETEAPEGYVTPTGDAAKTETRIVKAGQAETQTLTVSMTNKEEAKGEITLTKTGKDNAKLAGAKFDLYRVKTGDETADVKINTKDLVTDSNGEIKVTDLEPGTYYFVETEAPEGYVTPTGDAAKTETREVEAGKESLEPLTVSMTNTEEAKGEITLTKEGKNNAKLAGAKFDLYKVGEGLFARDTKINTEDLLTDANGEITVDNLEPGTYYFVETEAPKGYVTPTRDAAKTETRVVEAGKASLEPLTVSMTNTEEAKGEITLIKIGKDNAKLAGAKFDLYRVKTGDETEAVKINTEDLVTDANGEITVDNLEPGTYYFVETDAPKGYVIPTGDAAKTETRVVEAGKASLEPLSVTMTNTYTTKGEAEVLVKKNLEGRDWTDNDSFTFKIKAGEKPSTVDKQPMPEKTNVTITKADQDCTVSFGKIEFTEEGTYTYIVEETTLDNNGITCKERSKTIRFKVVDNDEGELIADGCDLIQTAEITNTYAAKGEGEIKVQKLLKGRNWTSNDSFTFSISASEGTPMPAEKSITVRKSDKNQTKSFGKIAFTKAGTYTYKIKESKGSIGGVTYDETEHTVTIKVRDNGKGELVADGGKLVQTEAFTNTYHVAETIGEVMVQKVLDGRKWNDNDEFEFTISAPAGTPMPEERSISITKEDADHIVSFGEIEFTEAGKYTYTIKETKGNEKGMTYDTKAHKVTIEVVDDGNGKLKAKNGTKLIQTVKITNTYRNNRVKTGDDSNMLSYMAIMLGAMLGFVMMLIYRRKHRA